ncbi:hypothetical protein GCK72_008097 [Caenorhabditis remanei]|uniref:Uncharacterized protein n=1 Tax=Caenorhabditis remanei TaxID=31234 RepID=A0A6A5HKS9_CAERE|nr:hypothetical protein GCK72_008097 [Caenorhabditis remanei]KAF1768135.1 hypothetical protein GCK72_008097 [Caenorhabditis remanei]
MAGFFSSAAGRVADLFSSETGNLQTQLNRETQNEHSKIVAEKNKRLSEFKKSQLEKQQQKIEDLQIQRKREMDLVQAKARRGIIEITEKIESDEAKLKEDNKIEMNKIDANNLEKLGKLEAVMTQKIKEIDDNYGRLKKDLKTREEELLNVRQEQRNQQIADIKEIEALYEKLSQSRVDVRDKQFLEILSATKENYEDEYKMEKCINDEDNKNFQLKVQQNNHLGARRIAQMEMLLMEQVKKLESDQKDRLKMEIIRLYSLKHTMQEAINSIIMTGFPTKKNEKIKAQKHLESVLAQIYGLSAYMIVLERKVAEIGDLDEMKRQIVTVKQGITKSGMAIATLLKNLKKREEEHWRTSGQLFIQEMTIVFESINTITMIDSGKRDMNKALQLNIQKVEIPRQEAIAQR